MAMGLPTPTGGAGFADPRFAPGTLLGKYELIAPIGSGGMASVILARTRGPGGFEKVVVIKMIHPHMAADQIAVSMLLDEGRLAALIEHPNVVHTYEVGEAFGTFYIVMEYLAGESLHTVIRSSIQPGATPFHPTLAAKIVADACDGLHAAHELVDFQGVSRGIVHRDISPGNVVVLYSGQVKVVDFGIAKAQGRVTETQAGELKGKFGYMSPEQINNEPMDRRSDIFSLGVTLWEALAKRRLFHQDNVGATLMQILRGPRVPPSTYDREVHPSLDAIAQRALQPDPRDRFQSAAEMKRAIDDAIWQTRVGTSEVQSYMQSLFAQRIEERRKLLAAATDESLDEVIQILTRAHDVVQPPSQSFSASGTPLPYRSVGYPDARVSHERMSHERMSYPGFAQRTSHPQLAPLPFGVEQGSQPGWGPENLPPVAAPVYPGQLPPTGTRHRAPSRVRSTVFVLGALVIGIVGSIIGYMGIRGRDDAPAAPPVAASVGGSGTPLVDPSSINLVKPDAAPPPSEWLTVPADAQVAMAPIDAAEPPPPDAAVAVTAPPPPRVPVRPVRPEKIKPRVKPAPADEAEEPVVADGDEGLSAAQLTKQGTDAFVAGDYAAAVSAYKRALKQNKNFPAAHRGLGLIYQRQGQTAKAVASLRRYLELLPKAHDAEQIRDKLVQLGADP